MKQGLLVILTGCSGAGKKTIRRRLALENNAMIYCPLYTTRLPKKKERQGIDYNFVTADGFASYAQQGKFLFSFQEDNANYGIDKEATEKALQEGKIVLIDVSHPIAKELRNTYKGMYTLTIDIVIPGDEAVEKRVKHGLHGLSPYQVHKAIMEACEDNKDTADYDVLLNNYDLKRTIKRCSQAIQGRVSYIEAIEEGKEPPAGYIIKRP